MQKISVFHIEDNTNVPIALREDKSYKYGFNGMERDDEVSGNGNSYNFGARLYNSRLGKSFTRDPLAFAAYPQVTPYSGLNNNPITNIDIDGKLILYFGGFWPGNNDKPAIDYWDSKIILGKTAAYFSDYTAMFFNGHDDAVSSIGNSVPPIIIVSPAIRRKMEGFKKGTMQAQNIADALKKQRTSDPNAKINVVAHSMGAAYSEGFLRALRSATDENGDALFTDDDFGEGLFFAPFQADEVSIKGLLNGGQQFSNTLDPLSCCGKIEGVDRQITGTDLNPLTIFGHKLIALEHKFLTDQKNVRQPKDVTPKTKGSKSNNSGGGVLPPRTSIKPRQNPENPRGGDSTSNF